MCNVIVAWRLVFSVKSSKLAIVAAMVKSLNVSTEHCDHQVSDLQHIVVDYDASSVYNCTTPPNQARATYVVLAIDGPAWQQHATQAICNFDDVDLICACLDSKRCDTARCCLWTWCTRSWAGSWASAATLCSTTTPSTGARRRVRANLRSEVDSSAFGHGHCDSTGERVQTPCDQQYRDKEEAELELVPTQSTSEALQKTLQRQQQVWGPYLDSARHQMKLQF